ncbi:hypothetical protein NT6N_11980 [Oceaniferula spumae]|uniref:GH3 middle domain-containing protein n=1 Tax=Oceaniferula spumae TaxID=2979115 RepID=A0AAT9FJG5_9BACT
MMNAARNWLESLRPYARKHEHACSNPYLYQKNILKEVLSQNCETVFGVDHQFASISSYDEFKAAVPVRRYQDFGPWMKRVLAGEDNILTREKVIGFEQTSGSSGGRKVIPITESFRKEMTVGIAGWMHQWKHHCPEVFSGPAYWSISPPSLDSSMTPAGVKIGMEDDTAYFPAESAQHLAGMLVLPKQGDDFFAATAEALLECRDLASISVWSPTFFLQLDQAVRSVQQDFQTWQQQWPNLQVLSCWTDAQAGVWMKDVRRSLGDVRVESKGLLATEGVSSVPDVNLNQCVMAAGSHLVEFMNAEGDCVMCDGANVGEHYEIVLTTAAGLYRYRTMDLMCIDAINGQGLPSLTFLGRAGRCSDLVGEKLTENFVIECMQISGAHGILSAETRGYRFFTENQIGTDQLEKELCQNPYYAQAVKLGQLRPMEVKLMKKGFQLDMIERRALATGGRLGDVKIPSLLLAGEREGWFDL